MSIRQIVAATLFALGASGANAATVTATTDDGDLSRSLYGLHSNTAATGPSIVGSVITATYVDGTSEELVWVQTSRWVGGISSAFISMSLERSHFMLETTKRLATLLFDAGSGGALFDVFIGGTAGSSWGSPYYEYTDTGVSPLVGDIDVSYFNKVMVAGDANEPSTYTHMLVDYTRTSGGGLFGETAFFTDLDDLAYDGDLEAVPLPDSLPLLMGGIAGLGLLTRRRRKS